MIEVRSAKLFLGRRARIYVLCLSLTVGALWLDPQRGDAQVAVKLLSVAPPSDNEVLLNFNFYRTGPLPSSARIPALIPAVANDGEYTWLLAHKIYLVSGTKAEPYAPDACAKRPTRRSEATDFDSYDVSAFGQFGGRWYVGTDQGLFVLEHGRARPLWTDELRCDPVSKGSVTQNDAITDGRDVSLLWEFGNALWFKASGYGIGRVRQDGSLVRWRKTSDWTTLAAIWNDSMYVVMPLMEGKPFFGEGERLMRLSDPVARDGRRATAEGVTETIPFLNANNGASDDHREILEVGSVRKSLWVIATDGVYIVLDGRAYWITEAPAAASEYVVLSNSPENILTRTHLLITPDRADSESDYLEQQLPAAEAADSGPDTLAQRRFAVCRRDLSCVFALTLFRLAGSGEDELRRLANSSRTNKSNAWLAAQTRITTEGSSGLVALPSHPPDSPVSPGDRPPVMVSVTRDGHTDHVDANILTREHYARCTPDTALVKFSELPGVYLWRLATGRLEQLLTDDFKRLSFGTVPTMRTVEARARPVAEPAAERAGAGCSAFVFTERGTFKVHDNQAMSLSGDITNSSGRDVIPVRLSGPEYYLFITSTGVFEAQGAKVVRLGSNIRSGLPEEFFGSLTARGTESGNVWFATSRSVFLFNSATYRFDRVPDRNLSSPTIEWSSGRYWIVARDEIDALFEGGEISASLQSEDGSDSWKQFVHFVLGADSYVSGTYTVHMHYVDRSRVAGLGARLRDSRFDFIASASDEEFQRRVSIDGYSSEGTPLMLSPGLQTLRCKLRDAYGNVFFTARTLVVAPSAYVLPILVAGAWVCVMGVMLLGAPYSRLVHLAVTNPRLRSVGSFGIIPLLLTLFPVLRNRLLRRYKRALRADKVLEASAKAIVPPSPQFGHQEFSRMLLEQCKVLLLGRSGLGKTTFFHYVCFNLADTSGPRGLRQLTPVFVSLARYPTLDPLEMFAMQLATYGDIHDKELAEWFLRQGGFAIFFDGVNEITEDTRNKLSAFVDAASAHNVICLSSQLKYEQFSGLSAVSLLPLNDDEIGKVLSRTLESRAVEAFFAQMNEGMRDIYCTPQNLVFAVAIMRQGGCLPESRYELYRSVFQSIEDRWVSQGFAEGASMLYRRAFDMLTLRLPFFESGDFKAPSVIVGELVENKLLARSGGQLMFSHELVRAFFAANYFMEAWECEAQVWGRGPDRNWLPMIEFCVTEFRSQQQVTALLGRLVGANAKLAGEVFRVFKSQRPELLAGETQERFLKQYAEAFLAL